MARSVVAVLVGLALLAVAAPAAAQTSGFTVEAVDSDGYPDVALTVTVENQLLEEIEPVFRIIEVGSNETSP